jgi:hypothetical protein
MPKLTKTQSRVAKNNNNNNNNNNGKTNKTHKTLKQRPSPSESATGFPEGTIRRGGNKRHWVIKNGSNGTPRWVPIENVEINGWRLLTIDYLTKNIGKMIEIYEREYKDTFPTDKDIKTDRTMVKLHFIPNGDAIIGKGKGKKIDNWLKTRKPDLKCLSVVGKSDWYENSKDTSKFNEMTLDNCDYRSHVTANCNNTESFIRVK